MADASSVDLPRGRRALTPDGFQVRLRITEEGQRAFNAYFPDLLSYMEHGNRSVDSGRGSLRE